MLHSLVTEFSVGDALKQYKPVLKGDVMEHGEIETFFFVSRSFHALMAGAAQMTVFWVSFFCNKLITLHCAITQKNVIFLFIFQGCKCSKCVINTGNYYYNSARLYTST